MNKALSMNIKQKLLNSIAKIYYNKLCLKGDFLQDYILGNEQGDTLDILDIKHTWPTWWWLVWGSKHVAVNMCVSNDKFKHFLPFVIFVICFLQLVDLWCHFALPQCMLLTLGVLTAANACTLMLWHNPLWNKYIVFFSVLGLFIYIYF